MANYQESRIKLTKTQPHKLKSAVTKKKTKIILTINKKTLKMKHCHMNYY